MTVQRLRGHQTFSGRLTVVRSAAGSDSAKCQDIIVRPLAGTKGFRQGALNIQVLRAAGQEFAATWDGNPDTGLKIIARNYGNNLDGVTRIGGQRALDIQARNSGTNLSWVKTVEINARNDSGKNVTELHCLHVRAENYGNVYTDVRGLDVEISDENTTQGQERVGLVVRSTDLSGMGAVDAVLRISHTSTNGITNLIKFASATGDTYTAKATAVGALGNTLGYARVLIGSTPGRIAVFDEWA